LHCAIEIITQLLGYHGYPRATGDMDIWIEISESNSKKIASAFHDFGIPDKEISENMFLDTNKVIRMGVPPVRIEIITSESEVDFNECYFRREIVEINGIPINLISLEDLRRNMALQGLAWAIQNIVCSLRWSRHEALA
jgi:hypothetical protein